MVSGIMEQLVDIIVNSVGAAATLTQINPDTPLIGNLLDSLAVNTLILGIEENFGFAFVDSDLSAEAFETVETLAHLIQSKLSSPL